MRALLAAAKGGDVSAARALLDRLVPPRKERPVKVALLALRSAKDARDAVAAVTAAVAEGEMRVAVHGLDLTDPDLPPAHR